ncbi:MAG TPA: excinuclease ABC subunit B, partial [Clostridiales bacterium]|nr:excinuclease ABC subunit B [Clostridiales bacterium]
EIIKKLVALQYTRSDIGFERNNFRVRGDVIEIFPSNTNTEALRVELFGDEIERVSQINTVTGEAVSRLAHAVVYPATHYVTNEETRKKALEEILAELDERIEYFESNGKLLEAQRIKERV